MAHFTHIVYAVGTWGTISNCWFFMSAVFSDLILLRLSLTLAYVFLLISAMNGLPQIPDWTTFEGFLPWGFVFWSCICGVLHFTALVRHLWDERPIKLEGDGDQVWRCMYRRSGMGKVEFLELMKRGTWNRFKKGDTIYLKGFSELCLHMIIDGVVTICLENNKTSWWKLYSGEMFDYRLFNLFGVYLGMEGEAGAVYQVNAETDCLLFTWHASQVSDMAFAVSPSVSGYWRNLILYMVGSDFTRRGKLNAGGLPKAHDANGQEEDKDWLDGARTRDMTAPLLPHEVEPYTFASFVKWLWMSLSPFPPVGLRHNSLPRSGMRAAARAMAFANQDHIVARFQDSNMKPYASSLVLTPNPLAATPTHGGGRSEVQPSFRHVPGSAAHHLAPMVVRYSSNTWTGTTLVERTIAIPECQTVHVGLDAEKGAQGPSPTHAGQPKLPTIQAGMESQS